MAVQTVTEPPMLDSTGQLIKSALLQIKDAVQPTNVGVDMPLSIPVSAWPNSAPYEFTWLSTKVTPECVVSVGYGEGAENIDTLYLYATKVAGGVKFTTPEKPVTAIPVVIHILNAAAESITAVDADMVATDAVNGASNVDQALSALDDTKQNKTDDSLATTSKTVVEAINEHDTEIGDLTNLTTTEKGSLVGAANELNDKITSYDVVSGTVLDLITALNSLLSSMNNSEVRNIKFKISTASEPFAAVDYLGTIRKLTSSYAVISVQPYTGTGAFITGRRSSNGYWSWESLSDKIKLTDADYADFKSKNHVNTIDIIRNNPSETNPNLSVDFNQTGILTYIDTGSGWVNKGSIPYNINSKIKSGSVTGTTDASGGGIIASTSIINVLCAYTPGRLVIPSIYGGKTYLNVYNATSSGLVPYANSEVTITYTYTE